MQRSHVPVKILFGRRLISEVKGVSVSITTNGITLEAITFLLVVYPDDIWMPAFASYCLFVRAYVLTQYDRILTDRNDVFEDWLAFPIGMCLPRRYCFQRIIAGKVKLEMLVPQFCIRSKAVRTKIIAIRRVSS